MRKNTCVKDIIQELDKQGYIEYGKFIPYEKLSELFKAEIDEIPIMNFMGPYLALKQMLHESGFPSTSRGHASGSLKILPKEDVAYTAEKERKRFDRRQKRTIGMLSNFDRSGLNAFEKAKIQLIEDKLIRAQLAITNVLAEIRMENCYANKKRYGYQIEQE